MNKKLVIFIVTLVVVISIAFVAVFGSESFGKYHKIKMDSIFFLKNDGTPYDNNAIVVKPQGQDEVILKWGYAPDNADVDITDIIVESNKPDDVNVKLDGEQIIITFVNDVDVKIMLECFEYSRKTYINFVKYNGEDEW
ncbi:MAG: hypothetical protein PHG08_01940 [Bacilli bacterium]|jgi:hypothetical protein|nr:hypothetical protein [Bacilli bacterium]HHU24235.1 hypothetical protein [Acholeplasmataceae bacterium]